MKSLLLMVSKKNVVLNQGVMLKIIRDGVYIEDKSIYLKPDLVN